MKPRDIRDITAQQQAIGKLKKVRAEYARRAQERAAELRKTRSQLAEAHAVAHREREEWDAVEETLTASEERLKSSLRELEARNRILHIFLTAPDKEMYAEVLAVVLEVMESRCGVFGYLDDHGDFVIPTLTRTLWDKCQVSDKRFVFPRATWGNSSWPRAIREKRTICQNTPSTLTPEGHISIARHISLPLIHRRKVIGLIQVANKESDYLAADVALLETMGRVITPVLDARLQRERQETARQQAEANQQLATDALRLLNRPSSSLTTLVGELLQLIKRATGFDAVGLRIREGEDFPYYAQDGFADDFVREENFLCVKGPDAGIVRDATGRPVLECTCGLVLSGRTDPAMPCFTEGGSFWTNKSSDLLALAPAADPRTNPRNRCIHAGYESVALIPLQSGDEIVGLLQLNDRRRGRFTPEMIQFLEGLAASIGIAIKRRQLEVQLQQAQKMEMIGRLAGGVAHDFNNLLMAILGYSDMTLSVLPTDNPAHKHVLEVKAAGERAAALTRQLLAFSRKQTLEPQVLNLNDLVANLNKMLRPLMGEHTHLKTTFDPALGHVKADPRQIEQVIINLAVNARDAMPEGGTLSIRTANVELDEAYASLHAEVTPGRYVLLTMSDTGTGMTDEVKAHLFEPFFTTKESNKGTGLGLASVYGTVKQSGGHITVYSERGHGTTFKVYLPRVEETAAAVVPCQAPVEFLRGTETILLVEDEEQVRNLARMILEKCGYNVLTANNGPDAVRLAGQHTGEIRLVLTDVIMPQMGGRVLAPLLKTFNPGLKVIYMSGYTDTQIIRQDLLAPGSHFLQKPIAPEVLARAVREVLDGR